MNRCTVALCLVAVAAVGARAAIGPNQVLLVVNDASAISQAIGTYYQGVRGIPAVNPQAGAGSPRS